jgi:hypothetical protein
VSDWRPSDFDWNTEFKEAAMKHGLRMSWRLTLATAVLLGTVLSVVAHAEYAPPEHRTALDTAGWPTAELEVIGYNFDPAQIPLLSTATLIESASRASVALYHTPTRGSYRDGDGYLIRVTSTNKLETADEHEMTLRFVVCQSVADAHRVAVRPYRIDGDQLAAIAARGCLNLVPEFGAAVGNVCVARDTMPEVDSEGQFTGDIDPSWNASKSRSLFAIYHNVYVCIRIEYESDIEAVKLLKEIITDMEAQRVAASGNWMLPQMQLNAAAAQVQGLPGPGASVNLSYSATWDNAICQRLHFLARRVPNERWGEHGVEPDPQQPHTYRSLGRRYLDDAENPTKVKSLSNHTGVGHYHVVMVAWGDNLLPKVVYQPLEVTD